MLGSSSTPAIRACLIHDAVGAGGPISFAASGGTNSSATATISRFTQARRELGKDRHKFLGEQPRWVPFTNAAPLRSKTRFTQSQVPVEGKDAAIARSASRRDGRCRSAQRRR